VGNSDAPGAAPAIGVSFSIGIPGERNLVLQTHVPQDMPLVEQHKLADVLCAVGDRILARYTLPALKKQLKVETDTRERMLGDLKRVDALYSTRQQEFASGNRRGKFQVPEKEAQQREQIVLQVKRMDEIVAELQANITECEGKVNIVDVRPDSQPVLPDREVP
jgi:hypothetical protein